MIAELCRLCGNKSNDMVCIFGDICEARQVRSKIEKVLHFRIDEEDILPNQVCTECVNRLDSAFHFIVCCHETQRRFKQLSEPSSLVSIGPNFEFEAEKMSCRNNCCLGLIHKEMPGTFLFSLSCRTSMPADDLSLKSKSASHVSSEPNSHNFEVKSSSESVPHIIGHVAEDQKIVSSLMKQEGNNRFAETSTKLDTEYGVELRRKRKWKKRADDLEIPNDEACQEILMNKNDEAKKEPRGNVNIMTDFDFNYVSDSSSESDDDDSDNEYCLKDRKRNSTKRQKQTNCKTIKPISDDKECKKSVVLCPSSKNFDTISSRKESNKEKKKLVCATCKRSFSQELSYEEHLNVHTGNRPFTCKLCEASFRKRQELNQHLRTVHSDKQFKCPLCEHTAKHKGKLTEHMKSVHEKPFACDQCSYRTGEKGKIQQHIANKHNGDLSYVCEICGNGFRTRTSLQAHRQNIHFPEPKVCQTCGTVCPSLARYSAHIFRCGKEKRRYPCEKCGQTYVNKEILKDHMNKHLNIRPYKCDVCGKEFFQRNRLDTHKYVHRGAAYRCEICNQSFNRKDNMKNHMKKHFYKSMRYDNMIVTAV